MRERFSKVWVQFRWRSQRKWNYRTVGPMNGLRLNPEGCGHGEVHGLQAVYKDM